MSIKIDQALVKRILEGGLEVDVVHENGGYSQWGDYYTSYPGVYEPVADRAFLEIKNFPAGKHAYSLSHSDDAVGLFQIIVKYPVDASAFAIKIKAEQVLGLFKVGASIAYQGQKVYIDSNSRDGGRIEGGFYQIVVRANYRAFVNR